MMNSTCINPHKRFSIVRLGPCDEGAIIKVVATNAGGKQSRYFYNCSLPKKVGRCKALASRFYFDQDANRCLAYGWGGCDSNGNNFESL